MCCVKPGMRPVRNVSKVYLNDGRHEPNAVGPAYLGDQHFDESAKIKDWMDLILSHL